MDKCNFKCEKHLGINVKPHPFYECGSWDFTEDEAKRLMIGMLYFHNVKAAPSYFGGIVHGYEVVNTNSARSKRNVLILESNLECKKVAWYGRNDVNAHFSGVLD